MRAKIIYICKMIFKELIVCLQKLLMNRKKCKTSAEGRYQISADYIVFALFASSWRSGNGWSCAHDEHALIASISSSMTMRSDSLSDFVSDWRRQHDVESRRGWSPYPFNIYAWSMHKKRFIRRSLVWYPDTRIRFYFNFTHIQLPSRMFELK